MTSGCAASCTPPAARRDPLTGLPGRDILLDRVDRLAHTRRELLHVLVADADGLKTVNDDFGHGTYDDLIPPGMYSGYTFTAGVYVGERY